MRTRVLIVDDEKNVRLMLRNALSGLDYDVRTAVNGEDALDKMKEEQAEVVLLDMKLPGMDGMEALRALHRDYPHTRVIMITAYGTVETAVEAMKLGAIDYLRKPFSPEQIRELIGEVAERQLLDGSRLETFDDLLRYAKLLLNRCKYNEALELLHRAVALNTSKPEPFNLMGIISESLGKIEEARKMYRAALALDVMYKPADANLTRISAFPYSQHDQDLGDEEKERRS